MKTHRRPTGAFTLVEAMISTALAGVLGGIIYLVAVESVTSFARNVSINRSYTEARMTLDRIAQTVGTAGHTPILIDTNGAPTTASPAAGIRFYRASQSSSYKITAGTTGPYSSTKMVTVALAAGQTAPAVKDLAVIPAFGGSQGISYQGTISAVSTSGTSCTLTFTNTIVTDCTPTPTATVDLTSPAAYLQTYTQVSYVVVGNQLRYYPQAKSVATDTATVFNSPANYQVLVNLVSSASNSSGQPATPLLPFSVVNAPTVQVQLYAENPDYNNRSTARSGLVNTANTYTYMQCSLGSRSAVILHSPF